MTQQEALQRLSGGVRWILIGLVGILVLGFLCRCGGRSNSSSPSRSTSPSAAIGTINARDENGDPLPGGVVNVWDDYQTRSRVVARCKDGERVTVLRRSGTGVQIRTNSGATGWISNWFLR